jgi:hypothetical protein
MTVLAAASLLTLVLCWRYTLRHKSFLITLSAAWKPIRGKSYARQRARWDIKQSIYALNEDVVVFIYNLKISIWFRLVTISVLGLAWFMVSKITVNQLAGFIKDINTIILGFMAIFFTVAIFMSGSKQKNIEEEKRAQHEFRETLRQHKDAFKNYFEKYEDKIVKPADAYALICAHAAVSVFNRGDYRIFKNWLRERKLDDSIFDIHTSLRYPYTLCSRVAVNRQYFISSCLLNIDQIETINGHKSTDAYKEVYAVAEISQPITLYVPHSFFTHKLHRVIRYGSTALLVGYLYIFLSSVNYSFDIFRSVDFHSAEIFKAMVIISVITSIYISLKYVFGFVRYLGVYGNSPITPMGYGLNFSPDNADEVELGHHEYGMGYAGMSMKG